MQMSLVVPWKLLETLVLNLHFLIRRNVKESTKWRKNSQRMKLWKSPTLSVLQKTRWGNYLHFFLYFFCFSWEVSYTLFEIAIQFEFIQDTAAWANSDRDYLYTELLERVFDIMRAKNPALVQGEKRRFVMKPPQVCHVVKNRCVLIYGFAAAIVAVHEERTRFSSVVFGNIATKCQL